MFTQHDQMFCRSISPMACKTVHWKFQIHDIHDPVAGDLCQDACRGDAQANAIASNQCGLWNSQPLDRETVHQGMRRFMSFFLQGIQCALHGQGCGTQDIELSDFYRTPFPHGKENVGISRK